MNKKGIILVGGGGHCKSCIDVIESEGQFVITGVLDLPENVGQKVLEYPIIGTDSDIGELSRTHSNFMVTIGQIRDPSKRIRIFNTLRQYSVNIPLIISPRAYVSRHARIGTGTIVMHFALVNASAVVGDNCIINTRALIEHDAVVGDHCHIATGSIVNGGSNVGHSTFYGSAAVSKEYAEIPSNSFVKANTIVK